MNQDEGGQNAIDYTGAYRPSYLEKGGGAANISWWVDWPCSLAIDVEWGSTVAEPRNRLLPKDHALASMPSYTYALFYYA